MKSGPDPLDPRRPELRQHKINRARQLLRDPNYPPKEVIESVAKVMARKLGRPKPPAPKDTESD